MKNCHVIAAVAFLCLACVREEQGSSTEGRSTAESSKTTDLGNGRLKFNNGDGTYSVFQTTSNGRAGYQINYDANGKATDYNTIGPNGEITSTHALPGTTSSLQTTQLSDGSLKFENPDGSSSVFRSVSNGNAGYQINYGTDGKATNYNIIGPNGEITSTHDFPPPGGYGTSTGESDALPADESLSSTVEYDQTDEI